MLSDENPIAPDAMVFRDLQFNSKMIISFSVYNTVDVASMGEFPRSFNRQTSSLKGWAIWAEL